jgi:type I restriction enzyme S subunit
VRERAVDFRNWDTLARVPIPVPPLKSQRARAKAFIERRNWTEQLRARIDGQVKLLAERRQAVITAAVTGQLEVPVAA